MPVVLALSSVFCLQGAAEPAAAAGAARQAALPAAGARAALPEVAEVRQSLRLRARPATLHSSLNCSTCSCLFLLLRAGAAVRVAKHVFCAAQAWLNHEYVVVGTKCNKLLLVNALTCELREVAPPLPQPRRPRSSLAPAEGQGYGSCGIHAAALNPDAQLLATGGANPNDCQVYRVHAGGRPGASAPALAPVQTLVVRPRDLCLCHMLACVQLCTCQPSMLIQQ